MMEGIKELLELQRKIWRLKAISKEVAKYNQIKFNMMRQKSLVNAEIEEFNAVFGENLGGLQG